MGVSVNNDTISKFIELNPQFATASQEEIISAISTYGVIKLSETQKISLFMPKNVQIGNFYNTLTGSISPELMGAISEKIKSADTQMAEKLLVILEDCKPEDLTHLLKTYAETNGSELYDEIKNSNLPKNIKKDLLKLVQGDFAKIKGYKPDLELTDTQIQNNYYTGENFDIKYSGQIVNITYKTTGEIVRIDLSYLLEKHAGDKLLYPRLAKNIQKLPAEVLFDLGKEVEFLSSLSHERELTGISDLKAGSAAGRYFNGFDTIFLFSSKLTTLVHELGHAIDATWTKNTELRDADGNLIDTSFNRYGSDSGAFKEAFDKNIVEYEADGNKRYTEEDIGKLKIKEIFYSTYMTLNPQEAYAECYSLLMTGQCKNPKLVKEKFGDCLAVVKQDIINKRKLPDDVRFRSLSAE